MHIGVPVAKRGKHTLSKIRHQKSRFSYSKEVRLLLLDLPLYIA